jgi:hypothetical protein
MLLAQEPAQSIQQSENVYENHMHTSEAARKGIRFCPPSTFFSLDAGIEYSRKHCGGAGGLEVSVHFLSFCHRGKVSISCVSSPTNGRDSPSNALWLQDLQTSAG